MKKTADEWFAEYEVCHRHQVNELIHWFCIPSIILSLFGLLWEVPVPDVFLTISPYANWATIAALLAMTFYLRLSFPLSIGMLLVFGTVLFSIDSFDRADWGSVRLTSLAIFVVAWIGQFIGHKLEGKKPAFFQDLQFLLISPAWLLGKLYRRMKITY